MMDIHTRQHTFLPRLGQRTRFDRLGELTDMEDCILNLQKAVQLTDDGHPNKAAYLSNLGGSQRVRFDRLGD